VTDFAIVPGFSRTPMTASLAFERGTRIGVGQGLNSEVYLIRDVQLDAQFVMKFIAKAGFGEPSQYYAEAQRLHDARHRHVVDLKYAAANDTHILLAMPYYRGGTLHTLLQSRFLTVREIVRYGLELLSGLHHVHVKQLLHLDVKPTNVLLDDSDTAALADFGLSREVTSHGLAEMPHVYVPHLPPERLTAALVSRAADIYQAGLTLYRMCNGLGEYERQIRQVGAANLHGAIAAGTIPDRKRFLPHIPARLEHAVQRALAVNPDDRFPTVLDLMNALAAVEESLDWRYQPDQQWGEGTWTESSPDGGGRRVTLHRVGTGWEVHSAHIASTGRERRAPALCGTDLTETAAHRLVGRSLRGSWSP
jgi:serine/threonine protein kinase